MVTNDSDPPTDLYVSVEVTRQVEHSFVKIKIILHLSSLLSRNENLAQ